MNLADINRTVSTEERPLIDRIVSRAIDSALGFTAKDRQDLEMNLIAVHNHIQPLRLAALADAPSFDFAHDICGIERHLNKTTCELENHFLPRFSARRVSK